MRDEQFQQAAEELLKDAVDAGATPSEKRRLEAGPDAIIVRLGFSIDGAGQDELVALPEGQSQAEPAERPAETPELVRIYRRITLRSQLALAARDCGARLRKQGCRCLSDALDQLADGQPDKSSVEGLAKVMPTHEHYPRSKRERAATETWTTPSWRTASAIASTTP